MNTNEHGRLVLAGILPGGTGRRRFNLSSGAGDGRAARDVEGARRSRHSRPERKSGVGRLPDAERFSGTNAALYARRAAYRSACRPHHCPSVSIRG